MLRALLLPALLATLLSAPPAAVAQTPTETVLALPVGAVETHRAVEAPGRFLLPIGRYTSQTQPAVATEGRVLTRVWRLPGEGFNTLTLLRALRPQLAQAGFQFLYECQTTSCGGFDFRFNTPVVSPPAMGFDLSDFRVLSARRPAPDLAHLSLIVSNSPQGGSLQVTEVRPIKTAPPDLQKPAIPATAAPVTAPDTAEGLRAGLNRQARVVLDGVTFSTGSSTLGAEQIQSLAPVAALLTEDPALAVVIVGHTDNAGSAQANIALSRARARAVRQALIDEYDIAPARIEADGVGYLLPRVPNTSDANRALNRRVEMILR